MKPNSYGVFLVAGVAMALSACDRSSPAEVAPSQVAGGNSTAASNAPPKTRYDLAERCFVMKVNDAYAIRNGTEFAASAQAKRDDAEHFFMQATGLGRY